MNTPTPGPWRVAHNTTTDSFSIYTSDPERDSCIAVIPESFGARTELANARLMAASPALYEALEDALTPLAGAASYLERIGTDEALLHVGMARAKIEKALAALKKARGEP